VTEVVTPYVRARLSPTFQKLFLSTCISNLGDGLRMTALPLLTATITRDPLAIGAVTAATMAPWLLGPVGGTMVDRGDRARLMVIGQLVRGSAAAALAAAVLTGMLDLWMVYAVAVIIGLGEVIVDSASQAVLPAVVEPHQLEKANGQLVAGMTITGEVLGAPLGGMLFAVGASIPLLVDAGTFLAAGLLLTTLRVPPRPPLDGTAEVSGFWEDVRAGLRALWDDQVLRPMAILVGLVNVAITASISVLVLFALDDLGMTEGGYGFLLGVGALGGLGGSLLADRIRQRLGRPAALVVASVAVALGMGGLAVAVTPTAAAVALGLVTFSGGIFNVVGRSLRQALVAPALLGRVIASYRVIGLGGVPIGAFLGGFLARATSIRTTMAAAAALLAVVAVGMVVTVRRIPPEHR
jgi:MFS family permease